MKKKVTYDDLEELYADVCKIRVDLKLYIESPQCFTCLYLEKLIRRLFEVENKIDFLQEFTGNEGKK